MIVLVGKTASGKDMICNQLLKHGYDKLITYTTRPIRSGEKQDETYHFISDDEFAEYRHSGFFAECRPYHTVDGIWWYGSALEDYKNNNKDTIVILNPSGLEQIANDKRLNNEEIVSFYVYSNLKTIRNRLKNRGDNREEAERRIESDIADFAGIESKVDKIIYNNEGTDVADVVRKILEYVKK